MICSFASDGNESFVCGWDCSAESFDEVLEEWSDHLTGEVDSSLFGITWAIEGVETLSDREDERIGGDCRVEREDILANTPRLCLNTLRAAIDCFRL